MNEEQEPSKEASAKFDRIAGLIILAVLAGIITSIPSSTIFALNHLFGCHIEQNMVNYLAATWLITIWMMPGVIAWIIFSRK